MSHASLVGTHRIVWIALMAALISVGGMIFIPIGPVPVSLETMFVALAGLVLGPMRGFIAVCLFLAAGAIGLPVFAGGKAGLGVLLGPTGGYLISFALTSPVFGLAGGRGRKPLWLVILLCVLAMLVMYLLGSARLAMIIHIPFAEALALGALPFLLGDAFKIAAAISAYRFLQRRNLIPA